MDSTKKTSPIPFWAGVVLAIVSLASFADNVKKWIMIGDLDIVRWALLAVGFTLIAISQQWPERIRSYFAKPAEIEALPPQPPLPADCRFCKGTGHDPVSVPTAVFPCRKCDGKGTQS